MIDSYDFGKIVIDGKEYREDVIIWPDHVDCPWWRVKGHNLALEDISEVIKAKPEVLIVGTGYSGIMKVSEEVKNYIEAQGIKVIIEHSKKACELYNKLSSTKAPRPIRFHSGSGRAKSRTRQARGKKVIACLHLTC